ncbi:rho GTPase-activating protein 24-like [Hemicordylus capensis]|uniref:rho GTPase-activating protein 24-like n=1 Tax=Hemicordylus capensis TaxID=884348 RepID=UPI00230492CA|nr:rho GTPase-activating protein 24-like [Hemicordylus capensis]
MKPISQKDINKITEISWKSCPDGSRTEETPVSRLFTGPTCTEEFAEANKATMNILGLQDSLEQGQMSNCSECFLSRNDRSTNHSPLQCHFISIQQQMARQKAEYEDKILSLEQRNKELQLEIKDLHSKLGQQRKWYNLVEIKIRNAEMAREEAERRNETLQREMEEFFDTFGELTNEMKTPPQQIAQNS